MLFTACNETGKKGDAPKNGEGYTIKGHVNVKDGDVILLQRVFVNDKISFDTLTNGTLKDGVFNISGKVDQPCIAYLRFASEEKLKPLSLALENTGYIVLFDPFDSMEKTILGGELQHNVFNYIKLDPEYVSYYNIYRGEKGQYIKLKDAGEEDEAKAMKKKYWKSYVASQNMKKTLVREKINNPNTDALEKALLIESNGVVYINSGKEQQTIDEIAAVLGSDNWHVEYIQNNWDYLVAIRKAENSVQVGKKYKDLQLTDIEGNQVKLSNVVTENKYVMLEFWASWCGPCRAEIPNLKKAYERFHDKGFEIVAVTKDKKRSDWEKASEDEAFTWYNTWQEGGSDAACKTYGISGVPSSYLIDSTGTIIASLWALRGEKLINKLEGLLE